jgi:hypothetical protein
MHEHEARLEALAPLEKRKSDARLRLPTEALPAAPRLDRTSRSSGPRGWSSATGPVGRRRGHRNQRPPAEPGRAARGPVPIATVPWLELRRGDRVGIVGPNGAGKTTLLRTIAGELRRWTARWTSANVQLSYLAQLRDAPIPGATVLDALLDEMPLTQGGGASHLARFLFRGDDVLKEVSALSGGERSRLELALLFLLPANLLLLDEPTNHLDIPAREALEAFMPAPTRRC